MNMWKVTLKSSSGEELVFNLIDIKSIAKKYPVLSSEWYDKFLERLESNFTLLPLTLEEIVSPEGELVLTPKKYASYMFILYKYMFKRYLPISYLLKVDRSKSVHLIAVYPEAFAKALKEKPDKVQTPLEALITSPEKVELKQLILAIPPTPKMKSE